MNFTTLLMDADDTIFDFPRCEYNALKEALTFYGFEFSDDVCRSFSRINAELWKKLELNKITKSELRVRRFSEMLNECFSEMIFEKPELLAEKYVERLAEQPIFIEGADEAVKKLSGMYDIYIITNGFKTVQTRRLTLSGLLPFVKGVFISEEIGAAKPKKEFFDRVLNEIPEKNKGNILVVGDSLTSDMQGGRNAGLTTCLVDPMEKTIMPHPLCDYRIHDLLEITEL